MAPRMLIAMFERDTTVSASRLRSIGYIPATIYGKNFEPLSIQVKSHEFDMAWNKGQRDFTLEGLGKTLEVEVKQIQRVSTQDKTLHIEFYVPSNEPTKTKQTKNQKAAEPAAPANEQEAVLA